MKTKDNKNGIDTKTVKKQAIAEKLVNIACNVSETDKARAIIRFDTNMSTVNRYLKGEVGFIGFGENLYDFLNKLIDKREKELSALAS